MTAETDHRQANVDLMNRFAHSLDVRDWALLERLYTPDASFHARERGKDGGPDIPIMTLPDRATIVDTLRGIWDGLSATHHMLSNHVVDIAPDGGSAGCSCYLRAHHVGNRERAHLFEESLGRFDFETVFTAGEWKIRRQDENIFIVLGTAEAFAAPPA